jgi:tetratricopeptide (TPR) repeat protein
MSSVQQQRQQQQQQSSSATFSFGYNPVEVTHDDYRRTVGYRVDDDHDDDDDDDLDDNYEGRNCMSPPRSMTRRLGNILMPPRSCSNNNNNNKRKKADRNIDNTDRSPVMNRDPSPPRSQCGSTVSGFSNQQSVANKTVDSQVTLKVSNKNQQPSETSAPLWKSRERSGSNGSASVHKPSTWKTLKRLVKGQAPKTPNAASSNGPPLFPSSQRKHATSYDGAQNVVGSPWRPQKSNSGSSLLDNAYPIPKRILSDEGRRRYPGYHSTPTTGRDTKNLLSRGIPSSSSSMSAVAVGGASHQRERNHNSFSGVASVPGYRHQEYSQRPIDHAIRGRLDGVDILSLGPVSRSSLPALSETARRNIDKKSTSPFAYIQKESDHSINGMGTESDSKYVVDPLQISFTDIPSVATPADLVADMIWMSGGKDQPEILLEGFHPGGSDRWTVRIHPEENMSSNGSHLSHTNDSRCPPTLQSTVDDDESTALSSFATEDGSTNLPTSILWNNLWGKKATTPPIPSHMQTAPTTKSSTTTTSSDEEDNILRSPGSMDEEEASVWKLASTCNVPFDLDDDAFIIDSPDHLQSVHELAMVSLQSRHFDSALSIFQKLQRGLCNSTKFEHLIGSTHHNIGMVHLLHGHYGDAMKSFEKAIQARMKSLPPDHPDIAVSMQRKAMAYFGLAAFNKAESCLEAAMKYFLQDDVTRAKILNNIGVIRYQLQDYTKALKLFTSALEMQRQWLEGPVKRESIVFDASVTLANMGKVYLRKGDYDLAYFVFEEACLMQTASFRKDHEIVLISLDNMARVQAKNGNQAEALRIFTSLARSQEARYGADSDACIETMGMKGVAHFKLLEFEEALECMHRVSCWQKKHLIFCHPANMVTKEKIKQIQRCIKGEEELWV